MSARLKALYHLQLIDAELSRAKKERASLDDGSAARAEVDAARAELKRQQDLLHEATAEMHDKDLNLKSVEAKRKSFRDKLYAGSVTNPKELAGMEQEIEMLTRNKGKLEERLLELMDIIEERKSCVERAEAVLREKEDALAARLAKLQNDAARLEARIEELTSKRSPAAAAVDPALLKRYEYLCARGGGVGIGKVADGSCGVCHTQVMPGTLAALKSDDAVETCENCGRLLYLEQ